MQMNRVEPETDFASATPAGTIASSSGRLNVAPRPFSTVRRERCRLVMNVAMFSPVTKTPQRLRGSETQTFLFLLRIDFFVSLCLCGLFVLVSLWLLRRHLAAVVVSVCGRLIRKAGLSMTPSTNADIL